ncbi:MAG: flagellar hook protein FlgE [Acidobacteria bacterium]|nr:flagellar hook protein FlgE [Acidobacteriota bacterium]
MAVGSFSAGLSGLSANQTYLSVIGNNLANINTIGYKSSAVSFADLVSQTVGGMSMNPMQVGLGTVTSSISPVFSQGPIESTRESTNVAIQGSGFFIVNNGEGSAYTRAGNFSFNADGELVTPDGWRVQGYTGRDPVTGDIITTGMPGDIIVPPGVLRAPEATTNVRTLINLDRDALVTGDVNFTTPIKIYDAVGAAHVVTVSFEKTAPGAWTYTATVPEADVNGGTGEFQLATGTLSFDGTGRLTAPTADITFTAPPTWANGAVGTNITWDITPPPTDSPSITSYASASGTSSIMQNGAEAGEISSLSVDAEGRIIAMFGAGQTVAVGQIALANFNNPKGLVKLGANRYGESQAGGIPNIGTAGTGGRGTLMGSSIEQSNVDIATEFTQMILAQRGYQANSRTITVSDELLVETLQMKR